MAKEEQFYDNLLLKGFEKITIENYQRTLKKFIKENKNPTEQQALDYLIAMRKKDYSYAHIKNTTTIIKNYMQFIRRPIEIEQPRRPITLPSKDILTEGEIARILAEANDREKAILSIFVYCGLRNKEVRNLKIKDIDFDNNLIKVFGGKFKKDRIVPMSKDCVKVINSYLKLFDKNPLDYLFTTIVRGNQYQGGDLRKITKKVALRARIKKRVYPHLFRHSWITHLLERGANVIAIQNMAGHSRLEITMQYTHFSAKKIQQEYMYYIPNYI